jgi:hypothetical protein
VAIFGDYCLFNLPVVEQDYWGIRYFLQSLKRAHFQEMAMRGRLTKDHHYFVSGRCLWSGASNSVAAG